MTSFTAPSRTVSLSLKSRTANRKVSRRKIAPREAPSGDAGKQAENASGGNEGEPRRREIDPMNLDEGAGVVTYDTGDWDAWPSYDLPVVFEFEVPALPEGFSEPSPPIPDE